MVNQSNMVVISTLFTTTQSLVLHNLFGFYVNFQFQRPLIIVLKLDIVY